MAGFLSKLFGGSKSEKDVKKITPQVAKINQYFSQYQTLSNDALRSKTADFKARIQQHLQTIDEQISAKKAEAEALPIDQINERDVIFQSVDALVKDRDKKIEEILQEILPEAFAVVKETSRRFSTNSLLVSQATDLDRKLAVTKEYITIEGDQSSFRNTWKAAGGEVTWNMVHYDVQLIGGAVLHSGKISEMATG
jgi:preprotein translocase subunit SecA